MTRDKISKNSCDSGGTYAILEKKEGEEYEAYGAEYCGTGGCIPGNRQPGIEQSAGCEPGGACTGLTYYRGNRISEG